MEKITLGKEEFKALAAETRLKIIKLLTKRKYTQSELSEELGLSAPTLSEHLRMLERAELVKKLEEGRKWKYFELTNKARGIIAPAPEQRTIWLVFATTIFALIGGLFWMLKGVQFGAMQLKTAGLEAAPTMTAAPAAQSHGWLIYLIVLIVLVVLLVILLKKRRFRLKKAVGGI